MKHRQPLASRVAASLWSVAMLLARLAAVAYVSVLAAPIHWSGGTQEGRIAVAGIVGTIGLSLVAASLPWNGSHPGNGSVSRRGTHRQN